MIDRGKMTVRERVCENENRILSPYAKKSAETAGRAREEAPCSFRTEFQRDRDRIIYSNSFKRLKNKIHLINSSSEKQKVIRKMIIQSECHTEIFLRHLFPFFLT